MTYATAKNASGILAGADKILDLRPEFVATHEATVINNAVAQLGGVAGDWTYVELTDEQYQTVKAVRPARCKLVNGVLTSATPITVTLSASTVEADGVASLTLTVNTHDLAYNGSIAVRISPPTGARVTATLTAIAGVGTDTLTTNQVGLHYIEVETVEHGLGYSSFEGV